MSIQYGEADLDVTNPQVNADVDYYINIANGNEWAKHIERGWWQVYRAGVPLDFNGREIPFGELI